MRRSLRFASLLVLACLAGGGSVGTAAERPPIADAPVASLEPTATAKLWKSLVAAQPAPLISETVIPGNSSGTSEYIYTKPKLVF